MTTEREYSILYPCLKKDKKRYSLSFLLQVEVAKQPWPTNCCEGFRILKNQSASRHIQEALDHNKTLFLTIDVQGAENIKKSFPDCLTFFVQPPDFDVLESRLRKRGTENEEEIRRRLENARKEMSLADTFDYRVLNDRLDRVALEIESIIKKQSHS